MLAPRRRKGHTTALHETHRLRTLPPPGTRRAPRRADGHRGDRPPRARRTVAAGAAGGYERRRRSGARTAASKLVQPRGVEPPCLAALEPESSVSAIPPRLRGTGRNHLKTRRRCQRKSLWRFARHGVPGRILSVDILLIEWKAGRGGT